MAEFDPSPVGPVASKLNRGTPLEKSFNTLARMICDMSNSMLILKQDNISLYKHMYKVEERLMKKLDAETYLEHNEERLKEEIQKMSDRMDGLAGQHDRLDQRMDK